MLSLFTKLIFYSVMAPALALGGVAVFYLVSGVLQIEQYIVATTKDANLLESALLRIGLSLVGLIVVAGLTALILTSMGFELR